MVTAFILMEIDRSRIAESAQAILALDGIAEVYSVAGPYDLIAVARVAENEQLAALVTEQLTEVEGICKTTTQIAFRQFSRFDLERMFEIGAP
jgi:DNA-binding Lrp family transcriptional regulator